jgi:polyisoprenoid-binding protein YceI
MNKSKLLICSAIILLVSAFTAYEITNWKVKDNYSVSVYQGGTKFVSFNGLKASILFDEKNVEKSKISASVDASSVNPGEENRALKEGAKKPEALDVVNFPLISFESTVITGKDNSYEATGNLTLKGITKEVKIPFTFENQVFKGGFSIDPKDFNITSQAFQKRLNIVLNIPVTR